MLRFSTRMVALAAIAISTTAFCKETLYATSLRSQIGSTAFIAGNLYLVDPSNAAATLIGSIKVGEAPVGVVALAAHPTTGVVYGITAGLSETVPRSLLEIDLESATARLIGRLQLRGTDLGFAPDGTLYMWAPDLHQLAKVDLATAATAAVGQPLPVAASGALAISDDGREAIVAINGGQGRMVRIDLRTGAVTDGPNLTGAPYEASIDNLTYSPTGVLYGVNSDGGAPSRAALVIVDAKTGVVREIGALPDDVRGLIFAEEQRPRFALSREALRMWSLAVLGVLAVALILYAISRP